MRPKIIFFALLYSIFSYSQLEVKVKIEDGVPEISAQPTDEELLTTDKGLKNKMYFPNADKSKNLSSTEMNDDKFVGRVFLILENNIDEKKGAALKLENDISKLDEGKYALIITRAEPKNELVVLIKTKKSGKIEDQGAKKEFLYCSKNDEFRLKEQGCENPEGNNSKQYTDIGQIRCPIGKGNTRDNVKFIKERRNRWLIIRNAGATLPELKKFPKKKDFETNDQTFLDDELKSAHSVSIGGVIGIFIENQQLEGLKNISIEIEELNYEYDQDVTSLIQKDTDKDVNGENGELKAVNYNPEQVKLDYLEYFESVCKQLEDASNTIITIDDLRAFLEYKSNLENYLIKNKIPIRGELAEKYQCIKSWKPYLIRIGPSTDTVKGGEEIVIKITITPEKGNSNSYNYTFKTTGGVTFGGAPRSRFYFTGLKNREAFKEDFMNSEGETEKRPKISDEDNLTVGVGLSGELVFRTGYSVAPILNIGAFIPLDEEISPYLAIGPGFTIREKRVAFSVSGGLAFGRVNGIKNQFEDVDVTDVDSSDFTENIWESSWYVSAGFSINLK